MPTTVANLTLTDAPAFEPSGISAVAGGAVDVFLKNVGSYPHTFTVSTVANQTLNRSWTPTELSAFFHANGSRANVVNPGVLSRMYSKAEPWMSLVPDLV